MAMNPLTEPYSKYIENAWTHWIYWYVPYERKLKIKVTPFKAESGRFYGKFWLCMSSRDATNSELHIDLELWALYIYTYKKKPTIYFSSKLFLQDNFNAS